MLPPPLRTHFLDTASSSGSCWRDKCKILPHHRLFAVNGLHAKLPFPQPKIPATMNNSSRFAPRSDRYQYRIGTSLLITHHQHYVSTVHHQPVIIMSLLYQFTKLRVCQKKQRCSKCVLWPPALSYLL